MTSAKNVKKLIRNAAIDTNQEVNESVLNGLLEELDKAEKQDSAASQPGIRRITMKSKIVKLAAAAVIIAVVAVGLVHWLPSGKGEVKIPPELVNKPIEELLDIHFGKTESSFDSSVVAAAVAKALDTLTPREILAIGQKYDEGVGISASVKPPEPLSLPLAIEDSDFVVHAHIDDVTLDVSDLKHAILNPPPRGIDMPGRVKATVDLRVLEACPSLPAEFEGKISFPTVVRPI
jgi:hypothetical protein